MAAPYRSTVLSLYRQFIREGKKVSDYNFRLYALRRARDAFRENQNVSDATHIESLINKAKENLEVLKRQRVVNQLFGSGKLIIENPNP